MFGINKFFEFYIQRKNLIDRLAYYSVFLIIIMIAFIFLTKNIDLKLAYSGFGPHDYVSQKMNYENYAKNFPNFIDIYDNSIVTHSYYFLKKYFNIEVSLSVKVLMLLQIILFVYSTSFFINTLFGSRLLTILSVVIIMNNDLAGLDLARFAYGYYSFLTFPLFYGYATAFSLLALSFYLKNKYFYSFIFLSIAVLCHQNIGFFTFGFIMLFVLFNRSIITNKGFLAGFFVFSITLAFQIYSVFSNYRVTISTLPIDTWLLITKIFCFHWYPVTMKSFTDNAYREFLPMVLVTVGFFLSLSSISIKSENHKKILFGILACFIMSFCGIVISEYIPIPLLIKISFHRASGIITFISVIYILQFIYYKIRAGSLIEIYIAFYFLLIMFNSSPGIALMPILLFAVIDLKNDKIGPFSISVNRYSLIIKSTVYIILFLSVSLALINYFLPTLLNDYSTGSLTALKYINPRSKLDFFIRGGGIRYKMIWYLFFLIFLISFIAFVFKREFIVKIRTLSIIILIPLLILSMFFVYRDKYVEWENRDYQISKDFLDVQLWAKMKTPVNSLFIVDPSHQYGWRDFSERSSFGNLREWLWFPVCYIVDIDVLNEGKIRAKEFGVDLDAYLIGNEVKDLSMYFKMNEVVQKSFNSHDENMFLVLKEKYKADYVVMNKKLKNNNLKLSIAYENQTYIVYYL